ncbi:double zinc ribbon domain-containing protein, partial [Arenimonas malthae]|uniref:double zinc ribbon domain-containing protein n=1 Tax=Arenimonas malthae TaxID=354197 RepID=UPI001FE23BB2
MARIPMNPPCDFFAALGRVLLPLCCLVCRSPGDGDDLCTACRAELPWNRAACARCGLPLPRPAPRCGRCVGLALPFATTRAVF